MGYTTSFRGHLKISPALSADQVAYIQKLNDTRRMQRDPEKINLPDPVREKVGLPLGVDGEFFVGAQGFAGQDHDASIINYNNPPSTQPGLWVQWTVSDDGKKLMWDGGEKFYEYIAWLEYLNDNLFKPWGKALNGKISWSGEDSTDKGVILVNNNHIKTLEGQALKTWKAEQKALRLAKEDNKVLTAATEEVLLTTGEPTPEGFKINRPSSRSPKI